MSEPSSLNAMDITLQLAAAFGQGAGVMLIEADALRPATRPMRRTSPERCRSGTPTRSPASR